MRAWIDGSWLQFDSSPDAAAHSACWVVEKNAEINGPAKLALLRGDPRCHIRAELPLDDEIDSQAGIAEVCAAFVDAREILAGSRPRRRRPKAQAEQPARRSLAETCRESGWGFEQRSATELAIELEIPDGFTQATLVTSDSGYARLSAEIVGRDSPGDAARAALATMLARACASFRMIRAALEPDPLRLLARLELVGGLVLAPHELSEALASLSVAVRLCAEEARVLARDEVVSRAYLARHADGVELSGRRRGKRQPGTQVPTAVGKVALNA
jgi:hypothetical protein